DPPTTSAGALRAGTPSSRRQAGGDAVGDRVATGRRAGLDELARQSAADDLLHAPRDGEQAVEVDAGLDTHGVKAVDEVLGADVAGGAGSEGAAAQPADRAV